MNYYEEILNLKPAKDFVRIIKKWDKLSKNLGNEKNVPMVLPDLFWVSKSGVGKTHLLKLLSEYIYSVGNLMEFSGNVKYFEFMLDYCKPDQPFNEIVRMIGEVSDAAGFRNIYKGIISIDIDEWVGHSEEKHFLNFLEYLSSNSDDWLIVFNVVSDNEPEIRRLESVLTMFFRLEKSILQLPTDDEFLQFIIERLTRYNLSFDESAKDLLRKTIEKLRGNKYFDGYKTLVMLCQDIVYAFYSEKAVSDQFVTATHLAEFAPDSKYIERATWKVENKNRNKIGFRG